jgi:hypothetical protein
MPLTRRHLLAATAATALAPRLAFAVANPAAPPQSIPQWEVFELSYPGPATGNPFTDITFAATFLPTTGDPVLVPGFYDGNGTYRLRFLPPTRGDWTFTTRSNAPALDAHTGALHVLPARAGQHGPVRVLDLHRFIYADGTPYRELGTTCYAWTSQSPALEAQTLETLRTAPFNKIRMCVFPKWYTYTRTEPPLYPFEGTAPNHWDFTRPNPAYFQHLEQRIRQLGALGIQADLILFHPYDEGHWGFDTMPHDADLLYLRYLLARVASLPNVWWSLANEWDLLKTKSAEDWEAIGQTIVANDPSHHLTSIHQQKKFFDHASPWITHVSVQNDNPDNAPMYLRQYAKPVIFDECRYEGDIPEGWGDITAERLVGNFWKTLVSGAWCGHGETYLNDRDELWWSKGGRLVGRSPALLTFFKSVLDAAPPTATLLPDRNTWGVAGEYYLTYLWDRQHATQSYRLRDDHTFKAEIIDTLAMTITPVSGTFSGKATIPLPIKPWQAIRLTRT